MRSIILIITGGIAAYKALNLIRLCRKAGIGIYPVLTKSGAEFVTPLSVSALAENPVRGELFALDEESRMSHIALARAADLVVVAPASANTLAKMAQGLADDLATTILLANSAPVLAAPAMNPQMWAAPATQENIATLKKRGVMFAGPGLGEAACGEEGLGRMAEPEEIFAVIQQHFARPGPLSGKTALVTAGPTHEAIDPVRYIANRSSGKQGYALAEALYEAGAKVTLISGPTALSAPSGPELVRVTSAEEMLAASLNALPADIAICAAAVADWRVKASASQKIKKTGAAPVLELEENPDILKTLGHAGNRRPGFVMGFAAETDNLASAAREKLKRKNCDAVVANDVSKNIFGADENEATCFFRGGREEIFPHMSKAALAKLLVREIAAHLAKA
ncbi:MAG TPA: bifunctional phosphopantothenoylcysteine decarboxylase/phosphopantothenate--cysteine ligase CoaBC [Alphaproteobacteria bacterium]|nr:bifunctional phosphopantothenoylcysteine decarboxylase/phosphopantothenate--cysteine ligase CoaBC [Alphaproteobacteria bacterium]